MTWTRPFRRWIAPAVVGNLVTLLLLCGHAGAQLLSSYFPEGVPGYAAAPGVTVLSRAHPEFDPLGIRSGPFMLWPKLETSVGYDSNVLASGHPRGSWTLRTQPSLLLASGWSRDAFGAFVSLADTRYTGLPAQDRTDGTVSVGGSVDIGRDRLTLAAAHITQHQDRSGLDAVAADKPVPLTIEDVRGSYAMPFGRWTVTPNWETSDWRFGEATIGGLPASQAFRNRLVLQGGVTARYEWAPSRNLLFVARLINQHYPRTLPGQPTEDSTGYQVLFGFDYDDDTVWRYRVLLGGEARQFAAFRSHNSFIVEAEASWTPSAMTTVSATLSRTIEDAAQEGVAGFTYTSARLRVDHEYLRNVILSAAIGLQRAEFLQGGGTQFGTVAGLGATWLANRNVHVSATFDMSGVSGARTQPGGSSGDYQRRLALLTVRLGL